jgi:hypothetical protein
MEGVAWGYIPTRAGLKKVFLKTKSSLFFNSFKED